MGAPMKASDDRTAFARQEAEEQAKRIRRAVEDVMDEGHTLHATAKSRRVPEEALRKALVARGWTPPLRVRQNNSRSRAKQLSNPRTDNQS